MVLRDFDSSLTAWAERFLFAPVNPTYAAVFRIALAVMLAVVFWPRSLQQTPAVYGIPGVSELYQQVLQIGRASCRERV